MWRRSLLRAGAQSSRCRRMCVRNCSHNTMDLGSSLVEVVTDMADATCAWCVSWLPCISLFHPPPSFGCAVLHTMPRLSEGGFYSWSDIPYRDDSVHPKQCAVRRRTVVTRYSLPCVFCCRDTHSLSVQDIFIPDAPFPRKPIPACVFVHGQCTVASAGGSVCRV